MASIPRGYRTNTELHSDLHGLLKVSLLKITARWCLWCCCYRWGRILVGWRLGTVGIAVFIVTLVVGLDEFIHFAGTTMYYSLVGCFSTSLA